MEVWCVGEAVQELSDGIVERWTASGAALSGPGGDEKGAEQANVKGEVGRPLVWYLASRSSVVGVVNGCP